MRLASIVALGLTVAAIAAPARLFAQAKPETPARPATPARVAEIDPVDRIKQALEDLKLTDDQKAKSGEMLARLKEEIAKSREEALKQGADRREVMRGALEKIRGTAVEISGLLNDEQKAAFQEKLQRAREALGNRGGQNASMKDRLPQLKEILKLDDEQMKKLEVVADEIDKKGAEIRAAGGPDARQKAQALRQETLEKVKPILTEEQFKKFQELMQQQGQGRGAAGAGEIIQRLQDAMADLNLTDDQKAKVKETFETVRKRGDELREQYKNKQPDQEAREKLRAIMDDLRTQIQSVLTPEQQEKLRILLPNRGEGPARPNANQ